MISVKKLAPTVFKLCFSEENGHVEKWVKFMQRGDFFLTLSGNWILFDAEVRRYAMQCKSGSCGG